MKSNIKIMTMTASEMGRKGGKKSVENRFKGKTKNEISKKMSQIRLSKVNIMKRGIDRLLSETIYLEYEGDLFKSEPGNGTHKVFRMKDGEEKEVGNDNLGFLDALRFGDEVSEKKYNG